MTTPEADRPAQLQLVLPPRPADEILAERLSIAVAGYTKATTSTERDKFAGQIRDLRRQLTPPSRP